MCARPARVWRGWCVVHTNARTHHFHSHHITTRPKITAPHLEDDGEVVDVRREDEDAQQVVHPLRRAARLREVYLVVWMCVVLWLNWVVGWVGGDWLVG